MTMVLPEVTDEVVIDHAQAITEMSRDELKRTLIVQIQLECAMAGHPIDAIDAQNFLTFMDNVSKVCKKATNRTFHLRSHHILFYHDVLMVIMRDDAMPTPLSAHDLINVLYEVGDGMTFVHTKDGRTEAADCIVKIVLVQHTR